MANLLNLLSLPINNSPDLISGECRNELKFIYSEKATKFCAIFTLLLSYVVPVKSKLKILQNFVAVSEYRNLKYMCFTG